MTRAQARAPPEFRPRCLPLWETSEMEAGRCANGRAPWILDWNRRSIEIRITAGAMSVSESVCVPDNKSTPTCRDGQRNSWLRVCYREVIPRGLAESTACLLGNRAHGNE